MRHGLSVGELSHIDSFRIEHGKLCSYIERCGQARLPREIHAINGATLIALKCGCNCGREIGALSLRNWRKTGAGWDDEGAGVLARSRFMSVVGMFVSVISALVIVAQWIAVFVYDPCQRT